MRTLRVSEVGVERAAEEAAEVLRGGGIVLYPTDTLYGLGVDAANREAVARLTALKGRNAGKAVSVVVPSPESIREYAEVPPEAERLIAAHLPGALTLVLPLTDTRFAHLAQDGCIGIRVPESEFTLALGRHFSAPYTATSANVSGLPSLESVEEIGRQFGDKAQGIDLVIDSGKLSDKAPSTVVKVVEDVIEVVREGALSREDVGL